MLEGNPNLWVESSKCVHCVKILERFGAIMQVFLARQPILDENQKIHAYEIFYRSGFLNHYTGTDDDEATSKVIIEAFNNLGLDAVTAGKPAFINFSTGLLEQQVATLFPHEQLVVEVLESVRGSEEVLARCRELKTAGYTIALDDFVYNEDSEPFLELADIVKIDLLGSSPEEIARVLPVLKDRKVTLLAEKVETYEAFKFATELGFKLFQGYFFSKPEMVVAKALAPLHVVCFELIRQVNSEDINFDQIAEVISRDVSLSYSLLRLVNSAHFTRRHPVKTVKQALVLLGTREIKKWVSLVALQRMCSSDLEAPVITSLVRGRFAELLAEETIWKDSKATLFLGGLFSMLDVLLQRPLASILEEVQTPNDIKELLLHGRGPYQDLGRLILAYEQGQWDQVQTHTQVLNLEHSTVAQAYLAALEWCPKIM